MAVFVLVLLAAWATPGYTVAPALDWPLNRANYTMRIVKTFGLEIETESQWLHLHAGTAPTVGLGVVVLPAEDSYAEALDARTFCRGVELRYTVLGLPVSPFLAASTAFNYTLSIQQAHIQKLPDGVHDISFELRGVDRMMFMPWPAFLHLKRVAANATSPGPLGPLVPLMMGDDLHHQPHWSPGVSRISRLDRTYMARFTTNKGFPANPNVTAWHTPPHQTPNLYLEQLTTHTELFGPLQMWWEDKPTSPGVSFVRSIQSMFGEDPQGDFNHTHLPFADGPRGVGWMSPYVQGKVDLLGRLLFAEDGGRIAWLLPTGEIITVAGRTLQPGKDPVWIRKSLSAIRTNQRLVGVFPPAAAQGFGKPMDVAWNAAQPHIIFVADYGLHCIWQVTIPVLAATRLGVPVGNSTVRLLAGTVGRAGFANGPGASAMFNRPGAIAYDSVRQALYVSDTANHAIRAISISSSGAVSVTTLYGRPDMESYLTNTKHVGDMWDRTQVRAASRVTVTPAQAGVGVRPDLYWPFAMRVQSTGHIVLMDHGYGYIRRIDPVNHVTTIMATVNMKFNEYDHGWAWLDVDLAGNSGPQDGVYWCVAVGEMPDGDHFNELYMWTLPVGGSANLIFTGRGGGANPIGFGDRTGVTPPHYPWLVAVDPRGGVYMAGMGEHGVVRLRVKAPGDPTATEDWLYYQGQEDVWPYGGTGTGPLQAFSLGDKWGVGGHNMIGLPDAYQTAGFSDANLLAWFGVPSNIVSDLDKRTNLLAYIRKQAGPARDGLRAAARDLTPPSTPGAPLCTPGPVQTQLLLSWNISTDNVMVAGYQLTVATNANLSSFVRGYGPARPIGNTHLLLVEALVSGQRYYAALRAVDVAGNLSPWGPTGTGLAL